MNTKKVLTTIAALGGLTIASINITNRIIYSISCRQNLLTSKEDKIYEWRFGKVKYRKKGTGSPLLLIHDLTIGSSSYEYKKLIDKLSESYEVYAIDLLGYGLSEKLNITYTNYFYVQMVIDFIKNVIGKKTDIITSGDSAAIAVMAAHNDEEVIQRIIMINPQNINKLNLSPSKKTRIQKFIFEIPVIGTLIYNIETGYEKTLERFREEYFYDKSLVSGTVVSTYVEASHYKDYKSKYSYASYIGRFTNTNIIHAIKQIDNCIYIIYGDSIEGIETTTDTYISLNNSIEKISIEKTRKLPHFEKPAEVYKQIKIFLN